MKAVVLWTSGKDSALTLQVSLNLYDIRRLVCLSQRTIVFVAYLAERMYSIVKPKNKETLSSPGRRGFLTSPVHSVQLILNFTIICKSSVHNTYIRCLPNEIIGVNLRNN